MMTKVLSNRLKKVLTHSISDFQTAFMSDRFSTDNIIADFEIINNMKWKVGEKMAMLH